MWLVDPSELIQKEVGQIQISDQLRALDLSNCRSVSTRWDQRSNAAGNQT